MGHPGVTETAPTAWWSIGGPEAAARCGVDEDRGLSEAEAGRRLFAAGRNELVEAPRKRPWRMVLDQFADTMIVVLLVAATVTALLGELRDTVVIVVIVALNASDRHRAGVPGRARDDRAQAPHRDPRAGGARRDREAGARGRGRAR